MILISVGVPRLGVPTTLEAENCFQVTIAMNLQTHDFPKLSKEKSCAGLKSYFPQHEHT